MVLGRVVARTGHDEQDRPPHAAGGFHGLIERFVDLVRLLDGIRHRLLGVHGRHLRGRHVPGHLGQPDVGRLAGVASLAGQFRPIGGQEQDAGKRPDAVFDAHLRPFAADGLGNAVLREVDHEQDDIRIGPFPEDFRRKNVVFEGFAVGAPVAAGEQGQHRAAGSLGGDHGLVIAGEPVLQGRSRLAGRNKANDERENRSQPQEATAGKAAMNGPAAMNRDQCLR